MVTISVTAPVAAFTTTDTIAVTDGTGTCAAPAGTAVASMPTRTTTTVTFTVTFPAAGAHTVCYTENGQPVVQQAVEVRGPQSITPTSAGITSIAGSLLLTVTGIKLDQLDRAKIVAGPNGDCRSATTLDGPSALTLVAPATTYPQASLVYTPNPLPYGGVFTVCYQSSEPGVGTVYQAVGDFSAIGPNGYTPLVVPVGTFSLTFDGNGLEGGAGKDRAGIASGGTCDDANMVASSDNLQANAAGKLFLSASVLTPGDQYAVCYRVASLAAGATATTYFKMGTLLTVSGATSYSPTTAPGAGTIAVKFTGVNMDSTAVGDSARLVRGTNCLTGNAVFTGGIPNSAQFTPVSVKGVKELSLDVVVTEGGKYTMCYKSALASSYVPLTPEFEVAGPASFYPTVVPQKFVGDLTITGALLKAGDRVRIIAEAQQCGDAATLLTWVAASVSQGTATIADMTTLQNIGNYRVCFTPTGGTEFEMPTKLSVSGAQGVVPSTLIAGVTTVVTVSGTNIQLADKMKLVDQSTEDCSPANPGHGTIANTAQAGKFSVTVPYGGVFTVCYNLAGTTTYTGSATVTVKGLRKSSPFSPVVAAVGSSYTFELEGVGLSALDVLSVVKNDPTLLCNAPPVVSVPALGLVSSTLVRANGLSFNSGGEFLMCYTVSGGPAMPQNPLLSVKGPISIMPTTMDFGVPTTVTFTGLALSARDTIRLADNGQACTDAATEAVPITTPGTVQLTPARGGVFYVCYRPFEGGFVVMPGTLVVAGPSTVTPQDLSANVEATLTLTGQGIQAAVDTLKIVKEQEDCTAAASFTSEQALSATNTIKVTPTAVGVYRLCYKLQSAAAFAQFVPIRVTGVASYSPATLDVSYNAALTLTGVGLDPLTNRVVISGDANCPTAAPDLSTPSGVSGTNVSLVYRSTILTGGTGRAVCVWMNNAWTKVAPPLNINGPISRENNLPNNPFVAGSQLQFKIVGQGLGGFDRVRWARAPSTTSGPSCTYAAITDTTVNVGTPILTPVTQLPGGKYILCYALGAGGEFVPVGTPLGGPVGGLQGEVDLSGARGFYLSTPSPQRIGQRVRVTLVNQAANQQYSLMLCKDGNANTPIPISTLGTTDMSFTGTEADVFPLRGGATGVCYKGTGGAFVALPQLAPGQVLDPSLPISVPGSFTVQGPSDLVQPLSVGTPYKAGTLYTFTLTGTNLTSDQNAVRWVPAADGCRDARWLTNSLASTTLLSSGTSLQTTFHVAGQFRLCYTYAPDTAQVDFLDLPVGGVLTTHGLYAPATALAEQPLGQVGVRVSIPYNYTDPSQTPPQEVYFWKQGASTPPVGAAKCPDNLAALPGVQKGVMLGTAAFPTYNTSGLSSGYHRVCVDQGAGHFTLPFLVTVRGPVAFDPPAMLAPGTSPITFSGISISDVDEVKLVTFGGACDGSAPFNSEVSALRNLKFTPSTYSIYATPVKYTVCYKVNTVGGPAGFYTPLSFPLVITGPPVGARLTGVPSIPTEIVAMTPFLLFADVIDASGEIVPINAATMTLTTDNSPAAPIPLEGGLVKPTVWGRANFTVALGTAGDYKLALAYANGASTFRTVTEKTIKVIPGNASDIAAEFSNKALRAGDIFDLKFWVVDAGYNALNEQNAAVTLALTPLDDPARLGTIIGVTNGTSDAQGQGTLAGLNITAPGKYRITLSGTTASGAALTSKNFDFLVAEGIGQALVISLQWAEGTEVQAGAFLSIDASVRDAGGNIIHIGTSTVFSLSISATPAPPEGSALFDKNPRLCATATSACSVMSEGVMTTLGVAKFRNVWLNKPGSYKLQVTAPQGNSGTLTTMTNTLSVVQGTPFQVRAASFTPSVNIGENIAATVVVRDIAGNVLTTSLPVGNVVAASGDPNVPLGGLATQALDSTTGEATFANLTFGVPGTQAIRFSHSTLVTHTVGVQVVDPSATGGTPPPSSDGGGGLAGWEIALIVLGVLFLVCCLAVLVCLAAASSEMPHVTTRPTPTGLSALEVDGAEEGRQRRRRGSRGRPGQGTDGRVPHLG